MVGGREITRVIATLPVMPVERGSWDGRRRRRGGGGGAALTNGKNERRSDHESRDDGRGRGRTTGARR